MVTEAIIAAVAQFDLIVVGAGIVGLAHALAAARRGLRVMVVEREARATHASVRNFGFVTVSGQAQGASRARALRSREIWAEVAPLAGIDVVQRGALVVAQREEALAVLGEFAASEMGTGCVLLDAPETRRRLPRAKDNVRGALASSHELRVEAREALPRLARWLAEAHGVAFAWGLAAVGFEGSTLCHAGGRIEAAALVVAPGAAVAELAPEIARRAGLRQCKLQMMRLRARPADLFPAVILSDLSLLRYEGFASQPAASRLRARLERDCAGELAHGVHLIVAQSADGSLVVGDSHHYGDHADPFASDAVESLILGELHALFDMPEVHVVERWVGHYPVADVQPLLSGKLAERARLVAVTGGTGMSTALAIGEETIGELFG
jgi:FAD dependent oxidoreductase TIGR03364